MIVPSLAPLVAPLVCLLRGHDVVRVTIRAADGRARRPAGWSWQCLRCWRTFAAADVHR